MADKVDMSLDDIISLNRKQQKSAPKKGAQSGVVARGNRVVRGGRAAGNRGARVAGGRGGRLAGNRGTRVVGNRGAVNAASAMRRKANVNRGNQSVALNNQATKKLVQKLVKNALKKRTIAAPNVLPARRRGGVAVASLPRQRTIALNRVLPRSKNIVRRQIASPRVVTQKVVRPVVRTVDYEEPEEYIEEAPSTSRRIIRQVPRRVAAPIRQRVISAPIVRQRVIAAPPRRQQVLVERIVEVPRRQQISRVRNLPQQVQIQRVQRPQPIRQRVVQVQQQQQRFQRGGGRGPRNFGRNNNNRGQEVAFTRKNDRFRSAIGLSGGGGRRQNFVREVERFEPVYTVQKVVRRGRGFADDY